MRYGRLLFSAGLIAAMGAATLFGDVIAYEVTGSAGFGTIDLTTSTFTAIGSQSAQLAGLGVHNGVLYGGLAYTDSSSGNILYEVNTATGALTPVGAGSVLLNDFGSTLTGLFGIGTNGSLYSVDPSTGVDTLIGATGLGAPSTDTVGLSTNSSILYYSVANNLYTLNTTTGAATLVGPLGTSVDAAMVYEGGSLWAGINSPLSVDTINTGTGAASLVANVSGTSLAFWGLAPDPVPASSAPEPAAWTLAATAGVGFAVRLRQASRRRRTALGR